MSLPSGHGGASAAQFASFLAVSLAVHAGLWAGWPGVGSQVASGETAAAPAVAASDAVASLVLDWTRPPVTGEAVAPRQAPVADADPVLPKATVSPRIETPVLTVPDRASGPVPLPVSLPVPPSRMTAPPAGPGAMSSPVVPEDVPGIALTHATADWRTDQPPQPQAIAAADVPDIQSAPPDPVARPVESVGTSLLPKPRPRRAMQEKFDPAPAVAAAVSRPATQSAAASAPSAPMAAGLRKPPPAATPGPALRQRLMGEWGGKIRSRIERKKRFPRGVRTGGRVDLRITVSSSGALLGVSVRRSSGHNTLDRSAVEAVRRARLPAAPDGIGEGSHSFNLPMAFTF